MYLYGAGGHSNVVRDILESNKVIVDGFFDDNENITDLNGCKITKGIRKAAGEFPVKLKSPLIISIGNNVSRAIIDKKLNTTYGTVKHPSAVVASDVPIGKGTVIIHGAIIQSGSSIGRHVIINTGASIDHHNIIKDYVHISPKAVLCGAVQIGEGTHVGAGAVIIPQVKIGKWCIIGAGAVVLKDIPDFSVAVGNPAKVLISKSAQYKKNHVFNPKNIVKKIEEVEAV